MFFSIIINYFLYFIYYFNLQIKSFNFFYYISFNYKIKKIIIDYYFKIKFHLFNKRK